MSRWLKYLFAFVFGIVILIGLLFLRSELSVRADKNRLYSLALAMGYTENQLDFHREKSDWNSVETLYDHMYIYIATTENYQDIVDRFSKHSISFYVPKQDYTDILLLNVWHVQYRGQEIRVTLKESKKIETSSSSPTENVSNHNAKYLRLYFDRKL